MDHFDHQQAHVFLPEELVTEILLRLPVESLVRFKIVCKNWCSMIDNYDFINMHFDHRSNHARLLVYHPIPASRMNLCTFTIYSDETLSGHHHLDYLSMCLDDVIGPVRGLFLLCGYYENTEPDNCRVALLNPATRECLPLFVPDSNQTPHIWSSSHKFGFGFDPLTGDFKVVALWYLDDGGFEFEYCIGDPLVAIYSLVNGCWKHLGPYINKNQKSISPNSSSSSSRSTYANGSCYWLLDYYANSLLSFDMSGDVFEEIEGPQNPMAKYANLVLHNDSLAVILYHHSPSLSTSMDLLVMRHVGCWTKDLIFDGNLLPMTRPLSIWKNNDLFVATWSVETKMDSLALYERSTHQIRELGLRSFEFSIDAFSYKKSLVSPKGGKKEPEKYNISDFLLHFFDVLPRRSRW